LSASDGNQTAEDIDAFAFLPDGSIIVSTVGPFTVYTTYSSPGMGSGPTLTGTGSHLLRSGPIPNRLLGANTWGPWEFYFDGSDVGLSSSSENINAVAV
jgi:hypothetical protein